MLKKQKKKQKSLRNCNFYPKNVQKSLNSLLPIVNCQLSIVNSKSHFVYKNTHLVYRSIYFVKKADFHDFAMSFVLFLPKN